MNLQNLFVDYQQVKPVDYNGEMPTLPPQKLFENLDRARQVANANMTNDQGNPPQNQSQPTWQVENAGNTSSQTTNNTNNQNTTNQETKQTDNIKPSNLKAYGGDRVKYWADKFAKLGFTPQQQVAIVASMMQECGLKPKGSVEAKELSGRGNTEAGWAGAGEGAVGFTHWSLKSRMIRAYNNHPQRKGPKLSEVKSEYAKASSRHIADLEDDDHALMVAIFYKDILDKTKNMNFQDTIGEFYLQKAGRGGSGKKGATPAERAFNRAKDYQATHARMGYRKASRTNGYEKAIADAKGISQKLGISLA